MAVDGQRFMTKTQHYRKVTKPLLERKRRARMNLYLDELKELIVDTMEAHGDQVNKLEKADILEMTVNYLKSRKNEIVAAGGAQNANAALPNTLNVEKFRAGYTQAAYEVSKVFATLPGLDLKFGARLMKHLGYQLKDMRQAPMDVSSNDETDDVEFVKPKGYAVAASLQQQEQQQQPHRCDAAQLEAKGEDVWRPW